MVRFPVEVSISLSPAIPILTLSIVAPPLASTRPVKVEIPVILTFLLTTRSLTIPTPPLTIKAAPAALIVSNSEVITGDASVRLLITISLSNLEVPSTLRSRLILRLLLIVSNPLIRNSPLNVTGPSNWDKIVPEFPPSTMRRSLITTSSKITLNLEGSLPVIVGIGIP